MTTSIRTATAVDKPRTTKGRFASPICPWAITEVLLPNYAIGYRVGESGRIYADQAHAVAFAKARMNRLVAVN